jgi:gliding motility-associated-like protein
LKSGFTNTALLFSLLLVFGEKTSATHLMGADLSYVNIGKDSFLVTLKVYRDCNGNPLNLKTPLQVYSPETVQSTDLGLQLVSVVDITNLCGGMQSKCAGGANPYGVEEYTFMTIVWTKMFPGACNLRLSWTLSARNTGITTMQGNQTFYTYATLNVCKAPTNNSPQIPNKPVAFICRENDMSFNNGMMDTLDGDSMSYALVPALAGYSSPCTYTTGFDHLRPLKFLGHPNHEAPAPAGFHLDPGSGDLTFRPTVPQIGVIVIQVTEWRKISGVYQVIGTTQRDMQIIVTGSGLCNIPPRLPDLPPMNICVGEKLSFDIIPTESDPGDSVKISWNSGIPGAKFTKSLKTGRVEHGKFTWTPALKDTSSLLYHFTVTVTDNACPFKGSTSRAYAVRVNSAPRVIISADDACYPDSNTFTDLSTVSFGAIKHRQWDFGDGISSFQKNAVHLFGQFGNYEVKLKVISDAGCIDSSKASVRYMTNAIAGFDITPNCTNLTDTFINTSHIKGGIIKYTFWSFGDGTFSVDYSPVKTFPQQGVYPVQLVVVTMDGCSDTMEIKNGVVIPAAEFSGPTATCHEDSIQFTNVSVTLPQTSYSWNFGDNTKSGEKDPTHIYSDTGTFSISLSISSYGCSDSIHKEGFITVHPKPAAAFTAFPDSTSVLSPEVQFTNLSENGSMYHWDFKEPPASSTQVNPVHHFRDTGNHWVTLIVKNEFGCLDETSKRIRIENAFRFYIPNSFSPNGDLLNDEFAPAGIGIRSYKTQIFNRWGQLVFEGTNEQMKWNGGYHNQAGVVQDGVFTYQISVTDYADKYYFYSGVLHLIK